MTKPTAPHNHIVYRFLPLAENTARKWYKLCQGEARGIDLDDVLAEAVSLLPSIAQTYKRERGSVVAVVKPAVWRHLERKFSATLRGDTERLCDEVPEGEQEATQERQLQAARVRAWASTPDRRALLEALDSRKTLTNPAQRKLLAELRDHLESPVRTAGLWSAGRAARYLRLPERHVRGLCESGELPAVRERGWCVRRQDADAHRRRKVKDALDAGATVRAAATKGGSGKSTAGRLCMQAGGRSHGPAPLHDQAELLSALTDETRAPHTWRRGLPCLRAVARYAGCSEKTVRRVYAMAECG